MKKFNGLVGLVVAALVSLVIVAEEAHSALTLPTSLSVTDMEAVAGLIIVAAAAIWVMRRVIAFFGK